MNSYFKDILKKVDSNICDDKLKFKLSDHVVLNIKESDETNIESNKKHEIRLDLSEDFDLDIEEIDSSEESSQEVEQLFDGYLGEKNFDPNPLEYGPNAMYRKNGTVYRKSVDNLWEAYLKDGSPGPRGAAGGSGVGVQEVQKIATEIVNNTNFEKIETNSPVAIWDIAPQYSNGTSTAVDNLRQTNILAPVDNFTHIEIEIENMLDYNYTGYIGIMAALSNNISGIAPSVGDVLTEDPRTGWVTVASNVSISARSGTLNEGNGIWKSGRIYMPKSIITSAIQRNCSIFIRYFLTTSGNTYTLLSTDVDDELGNKFITRQGSTTSGNYYNTSAGTAFLNTRPVSLNSNIRRVYFYNGHNNIGVSVGGASTLAQYSTSGYPWIGRVNKLMQNEGINFEYHAKTSNKTNEYFNVMKNVIDNGCRSHYILYPIFAGNDGSFEASAVYPQVKRFYDLNAYGKTKDIHVIGVILNHPVPEGLLDIRRDAISEILNTNLPVIDSREWMGRVDEPNYYKPEYTVDGTHLTQLGEDKMVEYFPEKLKNIIKTFKPLK